MKPVATSPEQLTSQVHGLSYGSPRLENAGCLAPGEDVNRSYPAMFVTTDARSAASPIAPSIPREVACLTFATGDVCPGSSLRTSAVSCIRLQNALLSPSLEDLPNEVLFHIMGFLDVNDLLSTSRTSHLLRDISQAPILHHYRLQRARINLPSRLSSPSRPTLADLITRSIFMTHTSIVSRKLARSLVSIRLSRRLAARPSALALVERSVLPKECVPGMSSVHVAPAIVAKKKAIEKERVKDGLRQWIASRWKREVKERQDGVRKWEESRGIGRVWRLRRFWERVSRGEERDSAW
ncbi:f-box domain protein [Fusarium subglutinans]|uniref:F-box domain protein n=1 Tax=Gibberella subglutinans TaxID=42677 RepID=A0A8H5L0M4_GIBSU|nr:f-box domain protein [Fusarium subglutinans]KAF5583257.1 f-box domain protein [Fusarium subglutinans]